MKYIRQGVDIHKPSIVPLDSFQLIPQTCERRKKIVSLAQSLLLRILRKSLGIN